MSSVEFLLDVGLGPFYQDAGAIRPLAPDSDLASIDRALGNIYGKNAVLNDGPGPSFLSVYNRYDGANDEWLQVAPSSITTNKIGTGSDLPLSIGTGGAAGLSFRTANTDRWSIDQAGNLGVGADDLYDIGTDVARPKKAFFRELDVTRDIAAGRDIQISRDLFVTGNAEVTGTVSPIGGVKAPLLVEGTSLPQFRLKNGAAEISLGLSAGGTSVLSLPGPMSVEGGDLITDSEVELANNKFIRWKESPAGVARQMLGLDTSNVMQYGNAAVAGGHNFAGGNVSIVAGDLSVSNGTTASIFSVYKTDNGAGDSEWLQINTVGGVFRIASRAAGLGTTQTLEINASSLRLMTGGTTRWQVSSSGALQPWVDLTGDLCAANRRPNNSYFNNVSATGTTTLNGNAYTWPGAIVDGGVLTTSVTGTLSWIAPGAGQPVGNVSGPTSSTDHAIARWDGLTGRLLQNSSASVSDAGELSAAKLTSDGQVLSAFGTASAPGHSFSGRETIGLFSGAAGALDLSAGEHGARLDGSSNELRLPSTYSLAWSSAADPSLASDAGLSRTGPGAAGISAGASSCRLEVYNLTDSATAPGDYERLSMAFSGGAWLIQPEKGGVATNDRGLKIGTGAAQPFFIRTDNADRWEFTGAGGHLLPAIAEAVNLGAAARRIGAVFSASLDVSGATTFNSVAYSWPGADAAGVLTSDGAGSLAWSTTAGLGDVFGPAESTEDAIATFADATGKLIKDNPIAKVSSVNGTITIGSHGSTSFICKNSSAGSDINGQMGGLSTHGTGAYLSGSLVGGLRFFSEDASHITNLPRLVAGVYARATQDWTADIRDGSAIDLYAKADDSGGSAPSLVATFWPGGSQVASSLSVTGGSAEVRNGASATTFKVFGSYDAVNDEWLELFTSNSAAMEITTNASGTGAERALKVGTNVSQPISLKTAGVDRWTILADGTLHTVADNVNDIGLAANRPRHIYGHAVTVDGVVTLEAGSSFVGDGGFSGNISGTRFLAGDGTALAPAYSYSSAGNLGHFGASASSVGLSVSGVERARYGAQGTTYQSTRTVGWSAGNAGDSQDFRLSRPAAKTFGVSSGGSAAAYINVYKLSDSASSPSNAEWLTIGWNTTHSAQGFLTNSSGSGQPRAAIVGTVGSAPFLICTNNAQRWQFNDSHLLPIVGSASDLGSPTFRMRAAYADTVDGSNLIGKSVIADQRRLGLTSSSNAIELMALINSGMRVGSATSDLTAQDFRMKSRHYNAAEEDLLIFNTRAAASVSSINIGGGSTAHNAATRVDFYLASNNTTLTGTSVLQLNSNRIIASTGFYATSGVLESSNGTSPGSVSAYGTTDNVPTPANWARTRMSHENGSGTIQTESGGVPAAGNLVLQPNGGNAGIGGAGSRLFRLRSTAPMMDFVETDQADKTWHLGVDGSEFKVVETNVTTPFLIRPAGRVGINNTTPNEPLDVVGNIQCSAQILSASGSVSAPGISFTGSPGNGFVNSGTSITGAVGGAGSIRWTATVFSPDPTNGSVSLGDSARRWGGLYVIDSSTIGFGAASGADSVSVSRPAANTIGISSGTSSSLLNVYKTTDSASNPVNAEWVGIEWDPLLGAFSVTAKKSGTAGDRPIAFGTAGNASCSFVTSGQVRWKVQGVDLLPETNNASDIGSSSQRLKTLYSTGINNSGTTTLNGVAYTWPVADGTADQILTTNGAGVLQWANAAGGGTGETNTGANIGTGIGIYEGKSGATLQFYSLESTDGSISLTQNLNQIDLKTTLSATNVGGGAGTYKDLASNVFSFRSLRSSDGSVTITQETDTINLVAVATGTGDVVGPTSSTDNNLVRWDGTTGKLVQDSTAQLTDLGALNVSGSIDALAGEISASNTSSPSAVNIYATMIGADWERLRLDFAVDTFEVTTGKSGTGNDRHLAVGTDGDADLFLRRAGTNRWLLDSTNNLTPTVNEAGGIGSDTLRLSHAFVNSLDATSTTLRGIKYTWPAADGAAGQVLSTNGLGSLSWISIAGSGDVSGPASSADNALTRFDGVTGKLIKSSTATLSDLGKLTVAGEIESTSNLTVGGDAIFQTNIDVVGTTQFNGVAYTWPVSDGGPGQVLSTDSAGNLSWATVSSGGGTGDVTGPTTSTDRAIATWQGVNGDALRNSGVTIDISDNLSTLGSVSTARLSSQGALELPVRVANLDRWKWDLSGNLLPIASGAYNIGSSGVVVNEVHSNKLIGIESTLGVSQTGNWASQPGAVFGHSQLKNVSSSYALHQISAGDTYVNAGFGRFLNFQVGGTTHAYLDAAGGFYHTTGNLSVSNGNSPAAALIYGQVDDPSSPVQYSRVRIENDGQGTGQILAESAGVSLTDLQIGTQSAIPLTFLTAGTARMQIDGSGTVTIGGNSVMTAASGAAQNMLPRFSSATGNQLSSSLAYVGEQFNRALLQLGHASLPGEFNIGAFATGWQVGTTSALDMQLINKGAVVMAFSQFGHAIYDASTGLPAFTFDTSAAGHRLVFEDDSFIEFKKPDNTLHGVVGPDSVNGESFVSLAYTRDSATFDDSDGAAICKAGAIELNGARVEINSLKEAGAAMRQVMVDQDGNLFAIEPPSGSSAWSDTATDTGNYDLGSGTGVGAASTIFGSAPATVSEAVTSGTYFYVNAQIRTANKSEDKSGSMDIGYSVNGAAPTIWKTVSIAGNFDGMVSVGFSTSAIALSQNDAITVQVRRAGSSDSSFGLDCNGSVQEHYVEIGTR